MLQLSAGFPFLPILQENGREGNTVSPNGESDTGDEELIVIASVRLGLERFTSCLLPL